MQFYKFVTFLFFAINSVTPESKNHCITPLREKGNCVSLLQCQSLRVLLENQSSDESVKNYLRYSYCGSEMNYPKVCCPFTNNDQNISNVNNRIGQPSNAMSNEHNIAPVSKLPEPNTCGRTNVVRDRIQGGETPSLGEWPWVVALGYRNKYKPNEPLKWLCGGSLISDRYVLTSGYCSTESSQNKLTVARLGDLILDPNVDDGASPQDIAIEKIIPHELYNRRRHSNDIAILKLATPAKFNKNVQPICLPTSQKLRTKLFVKYTPTVIGWGTTEVNGPLSNALMEVGLPIVENRDCNRSYSSFPVTIDNSVLCAGYFKGGKGSCQGDSGNPLMIPQSGQWYSIGIVSFGYKCGEPGYPGVYTRVTHFVDWILDKINNN